MSLGLLSGLVNHVQFECICFCLLSHTPPSLILLNVNVSSSLIFIIIALSLLVEHQEEHLARKKLSDEVLVFCLEQGTVQIFGYGPADATATLSSLTSLKSRMV